MQYEDVCACQCILNFALAHGHDEAVSMSAIAYLDSKYELQS